MVAQNDDEDPDGPSITEDPYVRQSPLVDTRERVLEADAARQGIQLGEMRYVLGISITLAIIAGVVLWLVFAT